MFAQVAGGDGGWERGEILDEEEAISGEGGKYKINREVSYRRRRRRRIVVDRFPKRRDENKLMEMGVRNKSDSARSWRSGWRQSEQGGG